MCSSRSFLGDLKRAGEIQRVEDPVLAQSKLAGKSQMDSFGFKSASSGPSFGTFL